VLLSGVLSIVLLRASGVSTTSCFGVFSILLACLSALVLSVSFLASAFRAVVRRLTLRLAFSYFLIGIVPIPLLAAILFTGAYLVAHQIVATRVYGQVGALAREEAASDHEAPGFRIDTSGRVVSSDVPWVAIDSDASWATSLKGPRPVIEGKRAWLAVPTPDRVVLLLVTDPEKSWARRLSQATGYEVFIEAGSSENGGRALNFEDSAAPDPAGRDDAKKDEAKPETAERVPASGVSERGDKPNRSWLDVQWIAGVYLDSAVASFGRTDKGRKVVVYVARTSPRTLFRQLFAQGVPDIGRIFWGVFAGLAALLLIVYLAALAIAFTLVGSIARNVNRLTRASDAIARGDFSVRVRSKSRDQIGDLARAFDAMATSIEGLLVETATKERLEAEIAVARAIQQKLLPPSEADLPGLSVRARFTPLAEIGGDYYDYGPLTGGRSTVAIGDVSGHGLSTGLLVAMAKAGLWTLLESGHEGTGLFIKLNELIHRSTDSRNYMTLALFTYDPESCRGMLTNAGQLAPYRVTSGNIESLSLPSFPLGVSPRTDFPTRDWSLARGDRLVFLTDGLIEASNPAGEPFGFERLESLLREKVDSDAAGIEKAILAALEEHSAGSAPEDDRTLVIVTLT
jgi:serine phosphatase RsbU (regulator of sigma subunit)